mgnify:CR=1 FL=1
MAHLRCDFRSDAMGMNTSMTVILPEKTDLSQVPVVYLLHGLEDNCTGWVRYTSVERYAREKNAGWRIDYFIVSRRIADRIRAAEIHNEIFGSDHCPVELQIDL